MIATWKKSKTKGLKVHRSIKLTRGQMRNRIWRANKRVYNKYLRLQNFRLNPKYLKLKQKKSLVKLKSTIKKGIDVELMKLPINRKLQEKVLWTLKRNHYRWSRKPKVKKDWRKKRWYKVKQENKRKLKLRKRSKLKRKIKSSPKRLKLNKKQSQPKKLFKKQINKGKQFMKWNNKNKMFGKGKRWKKGLKNKWQVALSKRSRSKWISPWRLYYRRKKIDKEVKIVWRKGEKMRQITKLGGRVLYRPKKRKFPRWWKLPYVKKTFKKRRSQKKIFGFRWLCRARNHQEDFVIRRRKFYSRCKRIYDFLIWKLHVRKSMLWRLVMHQQNSMNVLNRLNGIKDDVTPGLNVRRYQRLESLSEMKRLINVGKNKLVNNSINMMTNSSHSPFTSTNDVGEVNIVRYPLMKRYRRKLIGTNSTRSLGVSVAQKDSSNFENKLNSWRYNERLGKHRVNVLRQDRFSAAMKRSKSS